MTYTPGPWKIQKGKYTGDDWLVGSMYLGYSQDEEKELWLHITTDKIHASELGPTDAMDDARLIAAAPELLEALDDLLCLVEANIATAKDLFEVHKAQAAIAKATGGQP